MSTDHGALLPLDHSFFGSEWQKRWCVLNNLIFYYFGSEKGLSLKYVHTETLQVHKLNQLTYCDKYFSGR